MTFPRFLPLAAALLLPGASLPAERIETRSRITEVEVYPDRARITRSAEVQLPAGSHEVLFSELPASLVSDSVQAAASSPQPLLLEGVEVRDIFRTEAADARVQQLEQELESVREAMAAIAAVREDNEQRRKFLEALRNGLATPPAPESSSGRLPAAEIAELFAFYSGALAEITESQQELDLEMKELQPSEKALEQELQRLRAARNTTTRSARVALQSESAQTATVEITYLIGNASWRPLYNARTDSDSGKIQLELRGAIRQTTGEEWNGVQLTLSTARPSEAGRMPELQPDWLRLAEVTKTDLQANLIRNFSAGWSEREQPASEADPKPAPAPSDAVRKLQAVEAGQAYAEAETEGVNVRYRIPSAATIPPDGEPHLVPVSTVELEAKIDYAATPLLSDATFVRANVTNTSGGLLLPGEVKLFRNGNFVGSSLLELVAPDETFDFFLGTDDGIKVSTRLLVDKAAESGLLRKRSSLTRKREYQVENFKRDNISIEIISQIPVSQDEKIQVAEPRISLDPTERDKETGKILWRLDLEPDAKKTWTVEYSVGWPEGEQVIGLP